MTSSILVAAPAWRRIALLSALLVGAASCGFGSAGFAAALGGGSGTANAPSTPAGLSVLDPKTSPARILVVLSDAEGDAATIEFSYVVGGVERPISAMAANPVVLATSSDGVAHQLEWDFAGEPGLGPQFVPEVTVVGRIRGGLTQTTVVGLGNDAPDIDNVRAPQQEITGVVPVDFAVRDTSGDTVDVFVEFFDEADPGAGWRPARPAGGAGQVAGPAFRGVVAPPDGVELTFFWDTDSRDANHNAVGDLVDRESDVRLRFRPEDGFAVGLAVESGSFRVDNNDAPVMEVGAAFVSTSDDDRGVPIPFNVIDPESDQVRIMFQWRRESEAAFPPLGTNDPAELLLRMQDPAFIRDKHICTEFPAFARGAAVPVDDTRVRLPELLLGESSVLADGVAARELELLRPQPPAGLAATWGQPSRLAMPIAAVPLDQGLTALVLDSVAGGASLLEIELATGELLRTVASGLPGVPTALALQRDGESALVATDSGGWQLIRVPLDGGATTTLIAAGAGGASQPTGRLRDVLALGRDAALATSGDAVWRLDWSAAPGSIVRLRGSMQEPWGLALDPAAPGRVLVADRGADAIRTLDLSNGATGLLPAVRQGGGTALPAPTSIAADGGRLLVLCDSSTSVREICGLDLGHGLDLGPGSTDANVHPLGFVAADAASVAAGSSGLLLVTSPTAADLVAGGGIEQRRELLAFDTTTMTATVARSFSPAVRQQQSWRIRRGGSFFVPVQGSPEGTRGRIVWNSSDAGVGDRVLIRATAMDTETRVGQETSVSKTVENMEILAIAMPGWHQSLAVADFAGDRDL
ncbi:MAG: hypothetical protein KDC98_02820, partial [Planctomycetes bacterium]|nr:hypothetical protein [Planctomycetota bacterium]